MALLFMDSFDHYATADITEKWTQIVVMTSNQNNPVIGAFGRNSTQGIRMTKQGSGATYTGNPVGMTLQPGSNVFIGGCAFRVSAFNDLYNASRFGEGYYNDPYLFWLFNVNDPLVAVKPNTDGTLGVFRVASNGTGTLLGNTGIALQANVWAYVEVKVTVHDSAGTVDIKINGTSALSLSGQNTRGSGSTNGWTNVRMGEVQSYASVPVFEFDDVVFMDNTGSFNNDFLGDVTIGAIYPNGAGATTEWTPSAGSNYDCVNEALVNDDTDYNATSTVNAKDTYAFPSAPSGADIRAVQIVTAQRKATEGPGRIKHIVRSGGTDYELTEQGIGGTLYSFLRSVVETDPGSGSPLAAWTESGFNAAEFGIKKTG